MMKDSTCLDKRSAFRVMCLMWGKEIALKKCREFGIEVTEDELREQEAQEERLKKATSELIMSTLKENGGDDGAR